MAETTLISTFYRAEAFLPAALKFSPSKIVLIVNEDGNAALKENIAFVEKALSSAAHVKTLAVKHYDLYDVAKKTVDLIESECAAGNRIVVNVTGGRNTASLGVNFACYARKDLVERIVYVVEETNEFINLPRLSFGLSKTKRKILESCGKNCGSIPELAARLEKTSGMIYAHVRELKAEGYMADDFKLTTAGRIALL